MGGTPAQAWTSLEALDTDGQLRSHAEKEIAQMVSQPEDSRRFSKERAHREAENHVTTPENVGFQSGWSDPGLNTADWRPVTLPGNWDQLSFKTGGVFWLRKNFDVPESAVGKGDALAADDQ